MNDSMTDNREEIEQEDAAQEELTAVEQAVEATVAAAAPTSAVDDLEQLRRSEQAGQLVMTARMTLRRGQKSEAKKQLAQALKIDPSDIGALELLGDIFLEDAEQEKAIQVFEHGLKCHPDYAPFEEKLGQAHIDIAEMERDKQRQQDVLELGIVSDKLLDKKPSLAMGLSLIVPGAGQVYNDQYEKAAMHFGFWIVLLLTWSTMLFSQMRAIQNLAKAGQYRRYMPRIDEAIDAMSSGQRAFFWVLIGIWILVILVSATDAMSTASRLNDERRRDLGI